MADAGGRDLNWHNEEDIKCPLKRRRTITKKIKYCS